MNARALIAFLAILGMTGCIIVDRGGGGTVPPPPPPKPGDVTFTWSFAGKSCNEVSQVRSVFIDIPGEQLQNNGVYPCLANNYPGIVLHDFNPGTYSFTLEALGYGSERLFVGSGSFTVNGDIRVTVDLTPAGGANSYAYLTWRFPPNSQSSNPNCDQAGVAFVDVSIDGSQPQRFQCATGQSQPGAQTAFLNAGSHSITLWGLGSGGYLYYRFDGTLQTFAGAPVSAEYGLGWAVGGTAVKWQLTNGSYGLTCAQAGIQTMSVNFMDAQGNMVYGTAGDTQACDAAPIVYNYLQAGTYKVFIKGTGTGGTYLSNAQNPPVLTVQAGVFVTAQQAVNVQLFKAP
ncbi:MAG: hypothetical protein HYZ28_01850 [Myxococcales bacterium]|nr:hypothetical protein [Myxococcales bacterium]